jgi:hypothetical protein
MPEYLGEFAPRFIPTLEGEPKVQNCTFGWQDAKLHLGSLSGRPLLPRGNWCSVARLAR